jgi:hypothetical protein
MDANDTTTVFYNTQTGWDCPKLIGGFTMVHPHPCKKGHKLVAYTPIFRYHSQKTLVLYPIIAYWSILYLIMMPYLYQINYELYYFIRLICPLYNIKLWENAIMGE